jgi:hypothetical protein
VHILTTSPRPALSAAAPACTPGEAGIPDSLIGRLLCGRWPTGGPHTIADWAAVNWRLIAAAAVALLVVRLGWAVAQRTVWRRHTAQACWLEITPPVTATLAATTDVWRLLATLLPAPHGWTLRPARLAWEVAATPIGTRCGLWVPAGINPTAVLRVVQRGWPGARIEQRQPPALPAGQPMAAYTVHPIRPEWLPLVDEPPAERVTRRDGMRPEQDRMRAVYDGLASAGRTGGGLLQVLVGRAPRHRIAVLRKATIHPRRPRRPVRGGLRILVLLVEAVRAVVLAGWDLLVSPKAQARATPRTADPYLAELGRQARTKHAGGPHLLIAVRAAASGPTRAAARAAAADITSGFGLLGAQLTRRRLHRPAGVLRSRWVVEPTMMLATAAETAALAGLPAEPAAYGLPAAASRRRPAGHDVFHTGPAIAVRRPRQPLPTQQPPDDGPDMPWSTP